MSAAACTPISRSIPFVLAPGSRDSSPSTSTFTESVSLLSARLSDLDQARRRLGPDHLGTWAAGLGGLESTVLKGSIGRAESPWACNGTARDSSFSPHDEEDLARGIPRNMDEWQEWETDRLERRQKKESDSQALRAKKGSKAERGKRRKTVELVEGEADRGVDSRRDESLASRDPGPPARPSATNERAINSVFLTSKSTVKSSSTKPKPGPPQSTPQQKAIPTSGVPSPCPAPSATTLKPASKNSRKINTSWKSCEGGADEEILFEAGSTQMILPTSTQTLHHAEPLSSRPPHFLSSPFSLPTHPSNIANTFTSTPYHQRLDTIATEPEAQIEPQRAASPPADSNDDLSLAKTVSTIVPRKPKLHRLSSMARLGPASSFPQSVEDEGKEIEDFLGGERDSLE